MAEQIRDMKDWMRAMERRVSANGRSIAGSARQTILEVQEQINADRTRRPAAPIELVSQTYVALDPNTKKFRAGVTVDFPDVTIGSDAKPMEIESYELWGRDTAVAGSNFVRVATATISSITAFGYEPGAVWEFKVRAIGTYSLAPGTFSAVITVQMLMDTTPPPQPTKPVATASGAVIKLEYDGLSVTGTMPTDLDYIIVAGGATSSPTTEIDRFMPGGATLGVYTNIPYNTPWYFRLMAVDKSGLTSPWSEQATAMTKPLVDADIILSRIDAASTVIENIGSASILSGAILTEKLADNAISQAKLQDGIVAAAKLATSVNADIAKGINDAAAAQSTANTAQSTANGKHSNYYGSAAPAGTGFKVGDNWFREPDNRVHKWSGTAWVAIADTAIASAQSAADSASTAATSAETKAAAAETKAAEAKTVADNAQTSANNAASAASAADTKAVNAQTAADNAATAASNAQTSANNASTLANSVVKTSTSDATGTPPSVGAIWNKVNAAGDLIIKTWTANADGTAWVERKLDDAVLGNVNASKISAGIINAARFNATDIRAKFLEAGKVTAADIVAGTLTSASGVFGTMDASVINAGTLNAARLAAGDVRAKFLEAGKVAAADIVAGTLTSASGVFGTMDASVINAGTLNSARLNAGDVRAKFLEAGKVTAADMVAGTITAASGVIGSLDIGKVTTGTMSGAFITANTLQSKHLMVSDLVTFAPSIAESPDDWERTGGMVIVASALDTTGQRLQSESGNAASAYGYGPYKSVAPGEMLYASARIYRASGATASIFLRYYWYDANKVALASTNTSTVGSTAATGSLLELTATVPAGAAFARYAIAISPTTSGPGAVGAYSLVGFRQAGITMIADGAVTTDKVKANAILGKHLIIGDFQNYALGSDFEDASAIPWTLNSLHTLSTAQKKSGTTSLQLAAHTNTGARTSRLVGDLKVREGEQFFFSFHAYIDANFNGGINSKLRIGDQTNTNKGEIRFDAITRSAWTTTPLSSTFTVPAGVTSLTIEIWADHTAGVAYLDDIIIRRVAEASLIQNLGVEKLTAGTASMATGVIDKLWTDVVRSRSITTDMLVIGRGDSMVPWKIKDTTPSVEPHVGVGGGTLSVMSDVAHSGKNSMAITHNTVTSGTMTQSFRLMSGYTANNGQVGHFNVAPGVPYVLEGWVRLGGTYTSGNPNVRWQVAYADAAGSWLTTHYSPTQAVTWSWVNMQYEVMPPSNAASVYIYIQQDQPGMVRLDDPFMRPKLQPGLVADGAILTKHLTVTEDMTVKLLSVHKVLANEIDTNNLSADTGFISNMKTNILTADVVTSTVLKSDAITSKHSITGALFQTEATALRGIKISSTAFKAYNTANAETFSINASDGAVTGTGTFRTGTAGNYITMTGSTDGGIMRFFTGSGAGRGSIWARTDATDGNKLSIAYSDLDEPSGKLPVLAVTPAKAYIRYGSRTFQAWDNAGVEELLIDATGARTVVRGNMDFRDGRIQFRYGAEASLAFLGNRPESGSSADFEIRPDVGGIRLTGAVTNFQAYNLTTTGSANLNVSSSGDIRRSSSASRYKLDQREMVVPESALDVKMKDWIDRADMERLVALEAEMRPMTETKQRELDSLTLRRIPGMVAEDLEDAGVSEFVIYGPDGQTEGIMYDRFALAYASALNDKLDAALERIAALEGI